MASLRKLLVFAAVSLFVGHAVSADLIKPEAIEVRLFLSHSGRLSDPIDERSELWNTITGTDESNRPSTSVFVRVEVIGPPGVTDLKGRVDLSIQRGKKSQALLMHKPLGRFGPSGKQFVGFWLDNTGCESLQLTARTNTSEKVITRAVPFRCGE